MLFKQRSECSEFFTYRDQFRIMAVRIVFILLVVFVIIVFAMFFPSFSSFAPSTLKGNKRRGEITG